MLSLATLIFQKRAARILLAVASTIPLVFLLLTGSRGSLLALALGIGVIAMSLMIIHKKGLRCFLIWGMIGVSLAATLIVGIGGERFYKNFVTGDAGNVQRFRAWRMAPAMMAAAPNGWGERSGYAYNEWFQDEDDTHVLLYLVNTHLTWMVARGRTFSILYICAWVALFLTLLMHVKNCWNAVALAAWTLFFSANCFSTLGHFVSLWVFPILCTIPAVVVWLKSMKVRKKYFLTVAIVSPLFALGIFSGIVTVGEKDLAKMEVPIRNDGNAVYVGSGEPVVYIVPDYWVLGRYERGSIGRDIRVWCKNHTNSGTIAVVTSIEKIPKTVERLVLVGRSCLEYISLLRTAVIDKSALKDIPVAKSILFISPNLAMRKISKSLVGALHLKAYMGEFLAEVTGDLEDVRPWVQIVPECELYLPNWVEIAMERGL